MSEQQGDKTSTGLQPNVAGLLCYVATWVTGIIFLLIEKENRFVRFHAMQSIITFVGFFIVAIILNFIPIIGTIISILLWILMVILWIVLDRKTKCNFQYSKTGSMNHDVT